MVLKKNPNSNQTNPTKSDASLLTMSSEDAKAELRELIERHSKFDRDSILRSGKITSIFFDLKETILSSRGAFLTAICLLNMLKPNVKALGGHLDSCYSLGVSTSMLAAISGQSIDCFYVMHEGHAKAYGKFKSIDGPLKPGTKVCLIQDLVTSGSNMIQMIRKLKDDLDVEVIQVITLLDRNDGAIHRLDQLGIDYSYVFSVKEFTKEDNYSYA
jgi:orotate phosphoribosyltransferase